MAVGQDEAQAHAVLAEMLERLAGGPHHALGLAPLATADEVRAAFLQLTKTYHPARFGRLSTDTQKLSNEVFLGLRAAHDTLAKTAQGGTRRSSQVGKVAPIASTVATVSTVTGRPGSGAYTRVPITPATATRGSQPNPIQRTASGRHPQPLASVPVQPPATAPRAKPLESEAGIIELLQRGQWDAARAALDQLLAGQPGSPRYRALQAYSKGREAQLTGQRDEARVELENALQLDPDLQLAKTALGELFTRRK
ncbi:MAG: hypothetical protein WKG01_39285 [Kofleriaceae bacterium]